MAPRSGRDAAGDHRRRPRTHHRCPQLRLPQPRTISRCATRSAKYRLSHLKALDFYVSYWSEGLVGHTFLSFIFDNAPPLSISIETRPEVGEGFDPIASMFKQFELIYVVGEERDLVGVRANHRRETVYLYRLNASPTTHGACCSSISIGSTSSPTTPNSITC